MTPLRSLLALGLLVGICFSVGPAQEKNQIVTPVKYDGLKQEILKHRGKVVLVDFWATNCPPCKAAMPHYIELQKKLADRGLVVITVSVDPVERLGGANKFMTSIESPLRNVLLDEPSEMWQKKFEVVGLPFAYVFDRHGKWVRFRSFDYETHAKDYGIDIEKTVERMLAEK